MTPERAKLLSELIEEMTVKDKGFIPREAWTAVQQAFNLPYIELAVAKRVGTEWCMLLDYRSDEYWRGWHIPGGLWRAPWSIQEACAHLAKSELIDANIVARKEIMTYKWPDHPYGNVISHVVICSTLDSIPEIKGKREFFSEVPDDIVNHHGDFMKACFEWLKRQNNEGVNKEKCRR